ncbi:Hypothetical_protein [Hexamita inflata]|uniref:Hypothetical_protein n=1 Tax=Hexamita inflata TaxID=28002 RepID=A0AA86NIS1_9EUKA|nr:Hypothetical protein HINF_LOCUS7691 [Hexamita inflata]
MFKVQYVIFKQQSNQLTPKLLHLNCYKYNNPNLNTPSYFLFQPYISCNTYSHFCTKRFLKEANPNQNRQCKHNLFLIQLHLIHNCKLQLKLLLSEDKCTYFQPSYFQWVYIYRLQKSQKNITADKHKRQKKLSSSSDRCKYSRHQQRKWHTRTLQKLEKRQLQRTNKFLILNLNPLDRHMNYSSQLRLSRTNKTQKPGKNSGFGIRKSHL